MITTNEQLDDIESYARSGSIVMAIILLVKIVRRLASEK